MLKNKHSISSLWIIWEYHYIIIAEETIFCEKYLNFDEKILVINKI